VDNRDTEAARAYHDGTKLTYINLTNKPPLYKSYSGLPVISLPSNFPSPEAPTLRAVAGEVPPGNFGALDVHSLAQLLFFSAGMVRKALVKPVGEVHYRAAASAGALYPIDVYLVCQGIPGLDAGIYHFSPAEFSLETLRHGDFRGELVAATGGDRSFAEAPATLVFTATFWRSAWKYRERGYRYCFWDCGTMLANLLAACSSLGQRARLVAGFVDQRVDRLLRLHREQEGSICLVPVGTGADEPPGVDPAVYPIEGPPLAQDSNAAFDGQIDYPETRRLHLASCFSAEEEAAAWRAASSTIDAGPETSPTASLSPLQEGSNPLGEVIRERGSTRRFARDSIPRGHFQAILAASTKRIASDFGKPDGSGLVEVYTIVNAVDGLHSGSYYFLKETGGLELLQDGEFRERAGHLCFEQALGADASAVSFFMVDLGEVHQRLGNRGYRAAQLEAGIVGGNMYLCAHSLGLGATGMTFYDDEVTEFFSPHASGKSLMFLTAVGPVGHPNRVQPFRSRVAVALDALARGAGAPPTPDK